jgi:hypothetical protein
MILDKILIEEGNDENLNLLLNLLSLRKLIRYLMKKMKIMKF